MIFEGFETILTTLFYISSLAGVVTISYMIIRQNGNPAKTISWILLIVFIPFIGVGLYFTFGLNYRRRKLYKQKKNKDRTRYNSIIEFSYLNFEKNNWFTKKEVADNSGLAKLLLRNSNSIFSDNNVVEILNDGQETYSKLFKELESAEQTIHIQFYIFENGETANKLLEIFTRKRKQGVEIRLMYDAVGSWGLSKTYKQKLDEIGVLHHQFLPVQFVLFANKINYRNHRKIIVIDSVKGFTGGINISDKYIKGNHLGSWRDTFIYLEGNSVNGLQYLFLSDWAFASKEDHFKQQYFKRSTNTQGCAVQIVGSGPDSEYAGIMQEYDTIVHSAKNYVYISNPYLIPGEVILTALITSAMKGVDVRILIPGISDFKIVKWSSNSYITQLLRAGVKIYRYKKGFLHSKVMVADDSVSSVGTGNMDIRSFDLNFEVNAVVYSNSVAKNLKNQFEVDCSNSEQIDYKNWIKRPLRDKILESISRLISPLL